MLKSLDPAAKTLDPVKEKLTLLIIH